MKRRISWCLLLWTCYLILVISDWRNLRYFNNLVKELNKLIKKNSKYAEDGDFVLIHKTKVKEL
jgi:hypothetical protein